MNAVNGEIAALSGAKCRYLTVLSITGDHRTAVRTLSAANAGTTSSSPVMPFNGDITPVVCNHCGNGDISSQLDTMTVHL